MRGSLLVSLSIAVIATACADDDRMPSSDGGTAAPDSVGGASGSGGVGTGGVGGSSASGGSGVGGGAAGGAAGTGGVEADASMDAAGDGALDATSDALPSDGAADAPPSDAPVSGCPTTHLYAVAAVSATDVWVGGESVHHFDGVGWTEHALPPPVGYVARDLWLPPALKPWVVSGFDNASVHRWTGSSWEALPQPLLQWQGAIEPTRVAGRAVWGASESDVWIGGMGGVRRWDGSAWSAVGSFGYDIPNEVYYVSPRIYDVHGTSASDVWFAGTMEGTDKLGASANLPAVWHFDGNTVSNVLQLPNNPPNEVEFRAIHALAQNDVWVGSKFMRRWNGSTFSFETLGANGIIITIWGISTGSLWAIIQQVFDQHVLLRFDGSAFNPAPSAPSGPYWAIHGSSSTNVWMVGRYGAIARYDGVSWTEVCPAVP